MRDKTTGKFRYGLMSRRAALTAATLAARPGAELLHASRWSGRC